MTRKYVVRLLTATNAKHNYRRAKTVHRVPGEYSISALNLLGSLSINDAIRGARDEGVLSGFLRRKVYTMQS